MDSRRIAFGVLQKLEGGPQRLEKLLYQALAPHKQAQPRDRALATNLVYQVQRNRRYLDHLLQGFSKRSLAKLDQPVLNLLRMGAAELALLGTAPHAVVNAYVNLSKATPARRAQGLINGVLRAFARGWQEVPLPDAEKDFIKYLSIAHSHSRWMVEELFSQWGGAETEAWLKANQVQPVAAVRPNSLKSGTEEVRKLLSLASDAVEPHEFFPESLVIEGAQGPLMRLPGFVEGLWQAQDPGATALTPLLGVEPGMRVLDLCAGSGGKTGHLAALMENQGEILAVDSSAGRIRALKKNMQRLGGANVEALKHDGASLPATLGRFDRILIDAPCSGLGTLGRRPDMRWRRRPADCQRLAALQLSLLESAARLLEPGGFMLYCTCTMTRSENEQVVKALLAAAPELYLDPLEGMPGTGPDGYFRTFPHQHRCDAFFAARLGRRVQGGVL